MAKVEWLLHHTMENPFLTDRDYDASLRGGMSHEEHIHNEGHFHPLKGKGFFSFLKKNAMLLYEGVSKLFQGTRRDFSPRIRKLLQSIGDLPINKIVVRRDPISSGLETLLNTVMLGGIEKGKKSANYDKLFHLCLEVWVEETRYVVERNEIINIGRATPPTRDTQTINVPMNGAISNTLNGMLEQVRRQEGSKMYVYDPFYNNCQDFILSLLRLNRQLTPAATSFIKQPMEKILPYLPSWGPAFARATTDAAAYADTAFHGQGGRHTPHPPGGEGSISLKFHKQLEKAEVDPHRYLEEARRKAQKARLKGTVEFSDDSKHKLQIVSPEGKTVRFGAVGLGDHIYYTMAGAENAAQHRKSYLARATAIHGNWKKDKYSPNSLAIAILW